MADFDDDLSSLFEGEDLLGLLDNVQSKQSDGSEAPAGDDVPEASSALGSSEDAYQNLLAGLSDEETSFIDGLEAPPEPEPKAKPASKSIDEYDKDVYGYPQLDEIQKGIERGLDISFYDSADLNFRQMREIRIGLEQGLDVSYYCSKYYKDTQMREIRLGLMEGLDVSSYARLIYSLPDMVRIHSELLRKKYEKDPISLDFQISDMDTGLTVYTKDKQMSAYIRVKRKFPKGFDRKKLQVLLKIYGIEHGLMLDQLDRDLSKLKVGEDVQVAKGEEPVIGEDGWYEYFIDSAEESAPHVDEEGNIDYMARRQFSYVQPGQRVAMYHPATLGRFGKTVGGIELPAGSGKNLPRLSQDKIRLLGDGVTYVANKEGLASIKNGILSIIEQLEFKEDVGYGNNISFGGDIIIHGSVLESAIIQAGGDIVIEGTVEGAIVKAGGDIVIQRGVNADNKGEVEAGGNIVSSFFENANVVAGGSIEVDYIMNSNVYCKEKIVTGGRRSMICGGRVIAGEGVETAIIGNKFQMRTDVEVGAVSALKDNFSEIYKRRKELEAEMEKIRTAMATVLRKVGALNGRTNPVYLKFQDVLEQQKKEYAALLEDQDDLDEQIHQEARLYIRVEKMAYENTKLVINGNPWVLRQDIPKARFFAKGKEMSYDHYVD